MRIFILLFIITFFTACIQNKGAPELKSPCASAAIILPDEKILDENLKQSLLPCGPKRHANSWLFT